MAEKLIREATTEDTARPTPERTRFERIQLPDGQLSVVDPLPPDFPSDFVEQLIKEEPWNKEGELLDTGGRKPELCKVAGMPIVKKRSRGTGRELAQYPATLPASKRWIRNADTPSAQMAIVDEGKRRYRGTYGKELPLEEVVAFYIDKGTTEKYTFFRYYEEIKPELATEEGWRIDNTAREKAYRLDEELGRIGVDRGEGGNYVIVKDVSSEDGIKVVLIDTEFWAVRDQHPTDEKGDGDLNPSA